MCWSGLWQIVLIPFFVRRRTALGTNRKTAALGGAAGSVGIKFHVWSGQTKLLIYQFATEIPIEP